MFNKEEDLSPFATLSKDGQRLREEEEDFRPIFYRDIDRIINYASFTRYKNKTQVFSFMENDNIQTRMTHVLLVSKIARTIGRCLNLNEDLIEAISLAHDIGHCPLGHVGEKILNEISIRDLDEVFMHNVFGVRNYLYLERDGKGANLSIQVMDGILCHNGEMLSNIYYPKKKDKDMFLNDYFNAYNMHKKKIDLIPMTLEGCIVKLTDVISYSGRDLEDAIRLNFISREDIPLDIKETLGDTNRDIVNTLVCDVIENSKGHNYIKLSENVYKALKHLVIFNYENIYNKANTKERIDYYHKVFNKVYDNYLNDLNNNNLNSRIYLNYLNKMSKEYLQNNSNERKVIDYIALMTDEYLMKEYELLEGSNL